jgi:two-component system sensor histidine kinase BaeS
VILWTAIPFVLLLTALATNIVVRRAFDPLTAVIATADRISVSTLNERVNIPRNQNEVAALGTSLNRMIERLEAGFKSQRQFIADASHELRTPLSIVQSELEFANRSQIPESAAKSLHLALDELDHLRKLAGDLLLLAKLDVPDFRLQRRAVRLDEILAECVQRMTRLSEERNVSMHLAIEEGLEISADDEKIRSAVLNLIENALNYTSTGGRVDISLAKEGTEAVVTVRDTGMGIAPSDLPHIFKPFYRSESSRTMHSGSGLGLSIVRRVVELHGGSITLQAHASPGSTFVLRLPLGASGNS